MVYSIPRDHRDTMCDSDLGSECDSEGFVENPYQQRFLTYLAKAVSA